MQFRYLLIAFGFMSLTAALPLPDGADHALGSAVHDTLGANLALSVGQDLSPRKNNLKNTSSTKVPPPLAVDLNLTPNPEGGWYRETWRTTQQFHPDGYPGNRTAATAIYFVLGHDEVSQWHKVRSDELWLWQRGSPLELTLGGSGERPSDTTSIIHLGPSIKEGEQLQGLVPGGVWQTARPVHGEVLVSCIVAPGFENQDFTLLDK
ncbi:MAG: RmlC-like cupin domain-containing protein [Podila humilis]|nr:MAG: RmlC-like cupin domain-containing protein [Podila humilis]